MNEGYAITRAADNKGKRDERIKLHSVVVEHLKRRASFDPCMVAWNQGEKTLYDEFQRLPSAAGGRKNASQFYGFQDLRRAFATQNAARLSADSLQKLMRHKSHLTTQKYINMASQLDEAAHELHVPDVLNRAKA